MSCPRLRAPAAFAVLAALAAAFLQSGPTRAFTPAEGKAPMTVTLVRSDAADCGIDCPEWIAMTGVIGPDTPALLRHVLDRLGRRSVPVLVDSPGGAVESAMAMGRMIRARKLDVAVAGTALTDCRAGDRACLDHRRAGLRPGFVAGGIAACASACVFVLAAGTDRSVGQDSYVGVHQMVTRKTFNRVINTFRITRRMVGGRVVEVSRTLIATRPVSTRIVQSAAPEELYSEVDRYLLGMGIGESIMPLMHNTPPSGIHWMPPIELSMTGIATDTTDARTLVARSVAAPVSTAQTREAAALTLGDGRKLNGTVTWRVEPASPVASASPALLADIDLPDGRTSGTLSLMRNTDPADEASFIIAVRLSSTSDAGMPAASSIGAPTSCDRAPCDGPGMAGRFVKWGAADYVFRVARRGSNSLLSSLRDRRQIAFPINFLGASSGELALTLAGPPISDWERLCCGLAAPDVAKPAPPAPLPVGSTGPRVGRASKT